MTTEIKVARDFVGKSRFVINQALDVYSGHSSVGEQDCERRFSCTGFIFGDPGPRGSKGMLRS